MFLRFKLLILFALLLPAVCPGQSVWQWKNPLPQGNDLFSVAYGNNQFVAVSNVGTLLTSSDGKIWTARSSGTNYYLNAVTYGNGLFVAVGWEPTYLQGKILTSPDGVTWTVRTTVFGSFNAVTYGNNLFVAIGNGTIYTSPDGKIWTEQHSGTDSQLWSATFGNNQFVIVGRDGAVITSENGTDWTVQPPGETISTYWLVSVIFANGQYVAVGYERAYFQGRILTSINGKTWTEVKSSSKRFLSVTYGDNQFVTVGDSGMILTSPDASTWTEKASGIANQLHSVTYAGNQFVSVGGYGAILTSPDGSTWTAGLEGNTEDLFWVTYGNNTFVAVGNSGTILTSTDGTQWTAQSSGTTNSLLGVTYGNNQFVVVGHNGTILTSLDGHTWSSRSSGTSTTLECVTYGNNQFMAVGLNHTILTSADGTTWTLRPLGIVLNDLFSVAYGNNLFVALNGYGLAITSPDGIDWTAHSLVNNAYYMTYGSNQFVAVGTGGFVNTSSDGATWITHTSPTSKWLMGITYNAGKFVSVGAWGSVISSTDGISWDAQFSGTDNDLNCVAYGNNRFVAVGNSGTILSAIAETVPPPSGAPTLLSPSASATKQPLKILFSWRAVSNASTYRIQLSTSPSFSDMVVDDSTISVDSISLGPLSTNTAYYWRVNAKNAGGTSAWSEVWSFTTAATPEVPVLVSPFNNATNQTYSFLSLAWKTVSDASAYGFQLSTSPSFSTIINNDSALSSNSRTIISLSPGTTYYWRTNARSAGGISAWSTVWSFTTIQKATGAPTLVFPANSATDQQLNLSLKWDTIPGAETYRVQLSTTPLYSFMEQLEGIFIDDSTLTSTSKSIVSLACGTTYFWRVNARNSGGISSWSEVWKFTTIPPPPGQVVLLSPVNSAVITKDSVFLKWAKATGTPDKYWLEISTDSLMSNKTFTDSSIADTAALQTLLHNKTTYWWRVKAHNISGWGSFSATETFAMNIPSTMILPSKFMFSCGNMSDNALFINYALPVASDVSIRIFTIQGRLVRLVLRSFQQPGYYNVPSGIMDLSKNYYLIDFRAGTNVIKHRISTF